MNSTPRDVCQYDDSAECWDEHRNIKRQREKKRMSYSNMHHCYFAENVHIILRKQTALVAMKSEICAPKIVYISCFYKVVGLYEIVSRVGGTKKNEWKCTV